jgi:hypothetical protein
VDLRVFFEVDRIPSRTRTHGDFSSQPACSTNDPRRTRFLSINMCECGRPNVNVVQFRAYGKEFALTSSIGLTNGNETFLINCSIRWIVRMRAV